ncbi:MAG: hypothetical protein QMC77_00870 [Methanocellales archaeon]|nr:hypothetical protein [Methanocellales archaeon]
MPITDLEKDILKDLLDSGYVGKRHTPVENVSKGFPKHLRGDVKKAVKNLIRKGFILEYPTSHGMDVTLPIERTKEIKELLELL